MITYTEQIVTDEERGYDYKLYTFSEGGKMLGAAILFQLKDNFADGLKPWSITIIKSGAEGMGFRMMKLMAAVNKDGIVPSPVDQLSKSAQGLYKKMYKKWFHHHDLRDLAPKDHWCHKEKQEHLRRFYRNLNGVPSSMVLCKTTIADIIANTEVLANTLITLGRTGTATFVRERFRKLAIDQC